MAVPTCLNKQVVDPDVKYDFYEQLNKHVHNDVT